MKKSILLYGLFVITIPFFSYAGKLPCERKGIEGCNITLETKNRGVAETEIYLMQDGKKLFGKPEIQTVEHVYGFYKHGDDYYLKTGDRSLNNYNKQSIKFNPTFKSLSYINIFSAFNPDEKDMFWGGYFCETSDSNILEDEALRKNSSPLAWAATAACRDSVDNSESKHVFQGNDLLFDISSFKDGVKRKEMMAILIDGIRGNNPNAYLFGCVSNCPEINGDSKFIGRLGENIIKLFIKEKEGKVDGHYYYYQHGQSDYNKIYLEGTRDNNKMTLLVKDTDGKPIEEFIGHVNDGGFYGEWQDTKTHKNFPFSAYQMLF